MIKPKENQSIIEKNEELKQQNAEKLSDDKLGQITGGTGQSAAGIELEKELFTSGNSTREFRGGHLA